MFNGQLNSNEIFAAIYNMIISQEVFADNIKDAKSSLVDNARVDGSLYGDTKLYYSTDVLESYPWGNDAEAGNLLKIARPKGPKCQPITIDVFRQIALTLDQYMSKRAFSTEGAFASFNSVMLGWIRETKRIYDTTTYNVFIGTHETNVGKQDQEITLPTDTNAEAENRLQAQTIAQKVADVIVDLEDVSREYNNYGHLRSYSADDFYYVWNAAYVNKINKLDLPTIFNKDFIDKFAEYTLPARYFGKVQTVGSKAITSDGSTIRSLIEQDVIDSSQVTHHVFAGDLIPAGIEVVSTAKVIYPCYKEDSNVIVKIVHKRAVPYMSGFEVGTSFFNPRALLTTNYLTFGHNTITQLDDKPFITLRAKAQ